MYKTTRYIIKCYFRRKWSFWRNISTCNLAIFGDCSIVWCYAIDWRIKLVVVWSSFQMEEHAHHLCGIYNSHFIMLFAILALEIVYEPRLFKFDRFARVFLIFFTKRNSILEEKILHFCSKCSILRPEFACVHQFSNFIDAMARADAYLANSWISTDISQLCIQNSVHTSNSFDRINSNAFGTKYTNLFTMTVYFCLSYVLYRFLVEHYLCLAAAIHLIFRQEHNENTILDYWKTVVSHLIPQNDSFPLWIGSLLCFINETAAFIWNFLDIFLMIVGVGLSTHFKVLNNELEQAAIEVITDFINL